jgi:hypothetical protein
VIADGCMQASVCRGHLSTIVLTTSDHDGVQNSVAHDSALFAGMFGTDTINLSLVETIVYFGQKLTLPIIARLVRNEDYSFVIIKSKCYQ